MNCKRCIECGKFPFCKFIENPQKEACDKSIKKTLGTGGVVHEQRRSTKDSKR